MVWRAIPISARPYDLVSKMCEALPRENHGVADGDGELAGEAQDEHEQGHEDAAAADAACVGQHRHQEAGAYTRSHHKLNLRTFGNTTLTLELNLSAFGRHPRVNLGCVGDKVSFS
jgi:hypothetical protein